MTAIDTRDRTPSLVLPAQTREELITRARTGSPREVCGILGGTFGAERSHVQSQYPVTNVADRPRSRYRIDPEDQLEIFDRLEAGGEEIVGFYHSHPWGPPKPSETDARDATWPDRSYLIVSLDPFEIGSWRWRSATDRETSNTQSTAHGGWFERERVVLE